jgi:hypothetical protein
MAKRPIAGKTLRAAFRNSVALCKAHALATAITLIGVIVIAVSFGVLRPGSFNKPLLTTTVNATTESFQFLTPDGRKSAWSLPPGEVSILGTSDSGDCTSTDYEVVCRYLENTRLVVDGTAEVMMQMSPTGGWTLSVAETNLSPADVKLYDAKGTLLLESQQLLEFYAATPPNAIRVPFVADSAVLGSDLHQSSTIDGSAYDFWQPVLLSGDVLMISDNRPARETYKVLEERLDPGDVVHVGNNDFVERSEGQSTVWGMVSVASAEASSGIGAAVFHVVLHTSLREVYVTRFGAPEGHVIRASYWTIRQKWPNGQSAWIFFVSVVLVLTFILQLGESLAHRETDSRKRTIKKNKDKKKR